MDEALGKKVVVFTDHLDVGKAADKEAEPGLDVPASRVALTIHDFPQWPHWKSAQASDPEKICGQILAALEKHSIKGVYNFANSGTGLTSPIETTLPHEPRFKAMFDCWCNAGQHI